jgi:hypothetical protein
MTGKSRQMIDGDLRFGVRLHMSLQVEETAQRRAAPLRTVTQLARFATVR